MRIRFGRCSRGEGNDPNGWVSRRALRQTDEELDALGLRESSDSMPDDYTARLLASLAADVDDDAPPRRELPNPRRMLSRAAVATSLAVVALSGTGIAAAAVTGNVAPLQPLQDAVQALYNPVGESTAERVRALIEQARDDLAAGRLGDAWQALEEARRLQAELPDPEAEALADEISGLRDQLVAASADEGPVAGASSSSPSPTRDRSGDEWQTSPEEGAGPGAPVTDTPSGPSTPPTNGDGTGEAEDGTEDGTGGDPGDGTPGTPTPTSPSPSPSRSDTGTPGDGSGDRPGDDEAPTGDDGGTPGGTGPDGGGTSDDSTAPDGGGSPGGGTAPEDGSKPSDKPGGLTPEPQSSTGGASPESASPESASPAGSQPPSPSDEQ